MQFRQCLNVESISSSRRCVIVETDRSCINLATFYHSTFNSNPLSIPSAAYSVWMSRLRYPSNKVQFSVDLHAIKDLYIILTLQMCTKVIIYGLAKKFVRPLFIFWIIFLLDLELNFTDTLKVFRWVLTVLLLLQICFYFLWERFHEKKLIERSRICHNHKPQPTLDMKRKRKRTKTHTRKTNKHMYQKHKDQLPLLQARWLEC